MNQPANPRWRAPWTAHRQPEPCLGIGGIGPLSEETFQKFRRLIYEKTNIHMRESKQILISNRLRKRVLALRLGSYDEYYRYLTEGEMREEEMPHFIDAVSTNETYFFREPNHFTALQEKLLPQLLRLRSPVRIWSAGCSTGEEPYTLRIVFEEGRGSRWNGEAEIVATDISTEVIEKARAGLYRGRSLRNVAPALLARWFLPAGADTWRVGEPLRRGIEFRVHNLLSPQPPGRQFDLIFCRNVMIYFDKETQRRLVDEVFARVLDPQGYLCIGHSESLTGTSQRFRYVRELKAPIYQLNREGRQ